MLKNNVEQKKKRSCVFLKQTYSFVFWNFVKQQPRFYSGCFYIRCAFAIKRVILQNSVAAKNVRAFFLIGIIPFLFRNFVKQHPDFIRGCFRNKECYQSNILQISCYSLFICTKQCSKV